MDNINTMDAMDKLVRSFAKQSHLPELRARLEEKMPDKPYQLMAVYQRNRHATQECENWVNRPDNELAVSRYPNILAELDASGFWLDRIANYAQVSMEIMSAVMENGEKLSFLELQRLARCFGCSMDYLSSPVLSMVNPATNKGKSRLRYLKNLEQQTQGMDIFLYRIHSRDVLSKMESGKPVTYAAYRWACSRLQDVLDIEVQEAARKQRVRTDTLSPTKVPANTSVNLSARLQQARKREMTRKLRRQLSEIRKYADTAKLDVPIKQDDLLALTEFSALDLCGALLLAITYGYAHGCKERKALA